MKKFTDADLLSRDHEWLQADRSELVEEKGHKPTGANEEGYGQKISTPWKIHFAGKLRRIYCTCWSNAPSSWFMVGKDRKIHVSIY